LFWPILKAADALEAPIYLHPTPPHKANIVASCGDFASLVTDILAGCAWGWHIETQIHMIRIICGGAFDRLTRLQFAIRHMGEGLPFFFQKFDIQPMSVTEIDQPIINYLKMNVHNTFSRMNGMAIIHNLYQELGGADRINFSADYPYQSALRARGLLDTIPVNEAQCAYIAHGNTENLPNMDPLP